MDGREVACFNNAGKGYVTWDRPEVPGGIYLVKILAGAKTYQGKVVLVK
jgi:hypothetical protein